MISGRLRDAGRLRILITLVFGLIHGFGFAADLLQLQLPPERLAELLVGFNVGVEIGQLLLVAGATALVVIMAKYKFALPRPLSSTWPRPSWLHWAYSGSSVGATHE